MKKKVIALILYFALLLSSVFPTAALAEGEPEGGVDTPAETPVCICDAKCSEGNGNPDCPVCSAEGAALAEVCKGAEPQTLNEQSDGDTPANEQGGGDTPGPTPTETPVCTCTAKCSEGAVNAACPVCTADLTACAGQAAESGENENDGTPAPAPSPVCICTAKCSEGAVNDQCPVCLAEGAVLAEVCTGKAAESGEPEPDNEQEPDKGPESVTVTEWSWGDNIALAEDGKLYLGAAVTEENLEGIIALLPQYIQAGEEQIALRWTYEESSGSFIAALPEGYALAEGAKPLSVETVNMGASTLKNAPVEYIDENKQTKTCSDYTLVTDGDTAWDAGWYVAEGSIEISSRVTVTGNVKLILTNGCTLTVNKGINVAEGNSFTIYAQSGGTGALTVTYSGLDAGIGSNSKSSNGNITINGGNFKITTSYGAGIGSGNPKDSEGAITINGGNFVISTETGAGIGSGSGGENKSYITINGGDINITVNYGGAGIGGGSGSNTFGGGNNNGTILITGGMVIANIGYSTSINSGGAGIGGGNLGRGGMITISGGEIKVNAGTGAGIGGGATGDGGTVTITGGTVTATSTLGTSIGAGLNGSKTGTLTLEPANGKIIQAAAGEDQASSAPMTGSPFAASSEVSSQLTGTKYFHSETKDKTVITKHPSNQKVDAGKRAAFSVEATGS